MVDRRLSQPLRYAFITLPAALLATLGCASAPDISQTPAAEAAIAYIKQHHGTTRLSATTHKVPLLNVTVKQEYQVTGVTIPADQFTDETIEQLVKLGSLRSVTLLGKRPPAPDDDGPISLKDAKTSASPAAIAELESRFPDLLVYAIPRSEFTPIR